MTTIIGLLGRAGVGKSAAAAYLAANYGAVRYSLAAPLKEIAKGTMGFTDAQLYGSQQDKETVDPRYGFTPRHFLQRLGDEMRRAFDVDVFISQALQQIASDKPKLAVIEDCRYPNEVAMLHLDLGTNTTGYVWRLENPERITNTDATHPSESEWASAPYDYIIAPLHRGLPALHELIDDACKHYRIFPVRRELAL